MLDKTLEQAIERLFVKQPESALIAYTCLNKIRSGFFDRAWVDVVMQPYWRTGYISAYDAWIFALVNAEHHSGNLLISIIDLDEMPFGDGFTQENQGISDNLSDVHWHLCDGKGDRLIDCPAGMLAGGFTGGDTMPGDGFISWTRPLEACAPYSAELHEETQVQYIPPSTAVLEVGYTAAATTFCHLSTSGSLARWPYGSRQIWILHPLRSLDSLRVPMPVLTSKQQEFEQCALFAA